MRLSGKFTGVIALIVLVVLGGLFMCVSPAESRYCFPIACSVRLLVSIVLGAEAAGPFMRP